MTGEEWANKMTKFVFPAIRRKMPWLNEVVVQYSNARPHTKKSIKTQLESAARNKRGEQGMKLILSPQPPQSPDLNLNDLGFYSSFDTAIGNNRKFDLKLWWDQIKNTFKSYESEKLLKLVETKQRVVSLAAECGGDNCYKLPHGKKLPKNRH